MDTSPTEPLLSPSEKTSAAAANARIDWNFFRRCLRLLRLLYWSPRRLRFCRPSPPHLTLMTLALMVVAGIVEVGIFFIGTLTAEFYKVLTANDFEGFLNLCLKCLGLFILSGLFKSLQKLVGGLLQTRIRLTLTLSLQDTYFDQLSLDAAERLRCNEERKSDRLSEDSLMSTSVDFDSRSTLAHEGEFIRFLSLDNPDQRMTQDVDQWAQVWVRFLSSTLLAPFLITYYSYESVMTAGWICPVIIFSYFCLSSTLSLWIASPVARRIYEKEYWEGEYRYEHVRVRNQTEQIVTWKAENTEKVILGRLLRHLIKAQSRVFHWEFWTIWMTTFSAEFGSVVAFIVLGIPIFQGTLNIRIHLVNYLFAFEFIGWLGKYRDVSSFDLASIISKNAFFVMYLLYKFTSLIELSDVLSQLAGYTARISQLLEKQTCLRKLSLFDQSPSMPTIIGLDTLLSLTNYSFYLPSNARVCVEEFDVPALQPSITILSGPSGIGKTSFVRALCGLAPTNMQITFNGHRIPNLLVDKEVLVFSQNMVISRGNLVDLIMYPRRPSAPSCQPLTRAMLSEWMHAFNLQHLIHLIPTDIGDDYRLSQLSGGELQRLLLLRILFHRPKLVILDESTSNLDLATEQQCLTYILQQEPCALVWITHRPATWLSPAWHIARYRMAYDDSGQRVVRREMNSIE